eukprot:6195805-Amphidinium_carterae.1
MKNNKNKCWKITLTGYPNNETNAEHINKKTKKGGTQRTNTTREEANVKKMNDNYLILDSYKTEKVND